jgi:aminodeoxyfutalosine synthase
MTIKEKIFSGKRLDPEDAIELFSTNNLLELGEMADFVRKTKNQDFVYFTHNININPTNICINRCKFCAFSKMENENGSYTLSHEEIKRKAKLANEKSINEFHIVGGLNPNLPFEYYEDIIKIIRIIAPSSFIQAYTAVEIDFFSRISGLSTTAVLERLIKAGLGSIPGGGAEIFNQKTRSLICEKKISCQEWLKIHETAHQMGIKSNATMLYGHLETIEDRIDHLQKLRNLQDKTNGFLAFVPLTFHAKNTDLAKINSTTAFDDLKILAISRIFLDNFPHIRLLWTYVGSKLAQTALNFGVDDFGGTSFDEQIVKAAGGDGSFNSKEDLINLIKDAGRTPVETNSIYSYND